MTDSMTKDDVLSALGEISQHFENCAEATYGGSHERFHRWMNAADWAAAYLNDPAPTIGGWISADKRPPKQGRYLVWGLTRITPDHYDEANGFWEIQPAFWFEKSGWDRKVKFWQMLPEPPRR
jgi:hypothetical protein